MTKLERFIANVTIGAMLAGSLAANVCGAELFPFSNYPMYSRVSRFPLELNQFFGISNDGTGDLEVRLDRAAYFFPFSERTLRTSMDRLLRDAGRVTAEVALASQLERYLARRSLHAGPRLVGIRYYSMVLDLDAHAELRESRKALLAETIRP